jgi:hypothetical protein
MTSNKGSLQFFIKQVASFAKFVKSNNSINSESVFTDMMHEKFESNITEIFDKHVPVKEKYCRKNQLPYMNRELRKASYNKQINVLN